MKPTLDPHVLPVAKRLQYRMQTVRLREERLRGWRACFKQTVDTEPVPGTWQRAAVEQAHRPCVLMDVVGLPLWKN